MKITRHLLRGLFLFVLICAGTTAFAQTIDGVLPDKEAKTGTWTEWQSVKDSSGTEIAQYRIRLKSSGKFAGDAVECKYEIEVKSMTPKTMFVNLDFSYYQELGSSSGTKSEEMKGMITKKGKSWTFEFSTFTDKEKDKDSSYPCHHCALSYTLGFGVSQY